MQSIILVEGESDCWTLWFHGYHALGFPGASTFRKLEIWHVAKFERVIIVQEPDEAGARFVNGVEARLAEIGFTGTALVARMEGSGFKDPSDLHVNDPEKFKERFEAILSGAKPVEPPKIPTIYPKGANLDATVKEALSAVQAANVPPRWFIHEATRDPVLISGNGRPELRPLTIDALRLVLAEAAKWARHTANGTEPISPPKDLTAVVHTRLNAILPPLRSFTHVRMRKAGGGFIGPGYDPSTRLWCTAHDDSDVKEMNYEEAHDAIEEMLFDFHFTSCADKAHAVSLFLLPFMRETIAGSIPIYAVESPRAGTGKGLLAWSLLEPSYSFYMAPEVRKEEAEKYLTAAVLSGAPAFVFDNVHDSVTSAMLASLATSPKPQIRPLGRSDLVAVSRLPIFVITANNPTFSEENARRVARIRIDSNSEDPSLTPTSAFKHRLQSWIPAHRDRLQAAARSVIQHWEEFGPKNRLDSDIGWGSFEEWFEIMGGITEICGWPGLGETRMAGVSIDAKERRWTVLVEVWAETHSVTPIKIKDLLILADQIEDFWGDREIKSKASVMGRLLVQRRDQIFGDWKVVYDEYKGGYHYWRLNSLKKYPPLHLIK